MNEVDRKKFIYLSQIKVHATCLRIKRKECHVVITDEVNTIKARQFQEVSGSRKFVSIPSFREGGFFIKEIVVRKNTNR